MMSMNELDLFKYYWENQNQFSIVYKKENFTGSVPVSVIKKDYEKNKSKMAEEFIIKDIMKTFKRNIFNN